MPEARWGWWTLGVHGVLFAIPAVVAWTSSLDRTALLPMVALPTVLAVALELGLTFALVLAYSSANPDWDLS
jgi:hypothetical protein